MTVKLEKVRSVVTSTPHQISHQVREKTSTVHVLVPGIQAAEITEPKVRNSTSLQGAPSLPLRPLFIRMGRNRSRQFR